MANDYIDGLFANDYYLFHESTKNKVNTRKGIFLVEVLDLDTNKVLNEFKIEAKGNKHARSIWRSENTEYRNYLKESNLRVGLRIDRIK